MYSGAMWTAAGIFFVFLMSTLGAASALLFPSKGAERAKHMLMGFSAGIMTAASVWSLLLPAIGRTAERGNLPPWLPAAAGLILGACFAAVLGSRGMDGEDMLFAAMTLHNIPEGMAVGLAFVIAMEDGSLAAALALAFGIGVQNFPESAALVLPIRQSGAGKASAFIKGLLSGAVEPASALLALMAAALIQPAMPWLLSFSAGAMLCVSATGLFPERGDRGAALAFVAGFAIMMVLDVALG